MILPQVSSGWLFPDDNIPEEDKLKPEYGLKVARAFYSRYINGGAYFGYAQVGDMQETRNYGAGLQDTSKYKDWFTNGSPIGSPQAKATQGLNKKQRKALANISYDVFSPMPKMKNVLLSILSDNDYKVTVNSLDKNIIVKKKRAKANLYTKAKFTNPMAKRLGLPESKIPFVPKDEAMIEMADKLGFFKTRTEVALEKLSEAGFRLSNWKNELRNNINNDAIDYHFRAAKVEVDDFGLVKPTYIDPCRLVMLWNEDNQDEPVAIGHIAIKTIADVFPQLIEAGFKEEQIQAMAKSYATFQVTMGFGAVPNWAFERKDPTTSKWVWMDFKIYTLQFEYLSTDYKAYAKRSVKGNMYYDKLKKPEAFKKKNPDAEVDEYQINYWYEGSYIIGGAGMDMIYGWRKKPNQYRNGLKPMSSYVIQRIQGNSPTRRVRALLDDLMMAKLKLRAAVQAAAPKGYTINIADAANIKIGDQEYSVFDLVHVHRQTGLRVVSTKFNSQSGKYVATPLQENENGLGVQGREWVEQIANIQMEIRDLMGIPDSMSAAPDQSAERLVGVMEQDYIAGNNANWLLRDTERDFKKKLSERIILYARTCIQYDPTVREYYESIFGKDMIEALNEVEGLSLDQIATSTEVIPNEKKKDAIYQDALMLSQKTLANGTQLLTASALGRIRQLLENDDIKEALWFMAQEEENSRKMDEERAVRMSQMNGHVQMQSLQTSEQLKLQAALQMAKIEIMKEREKANFEMLKEQEIAKIKADSAYQVQVLKGEQALDEITLEATLEAQTGNEITGRI